MSGSKVLLFILLLYPALNHAQKKKVIQAWEAGIANFEKKAFLTAANEFQKLTEDGTYGERALFMTGLCYYYAKQYDVSHDYFQQFTQRYPGSELIPWAQYHRALCLIESDKQVEGGLYILRTLLEEPLPYSLKSRVESAIQYLLYERLELSFLKEYKDKAHPLLRPWVYEAYCFHLYEKEKKASQDFSQIQRELAEYRRKYGELTENMKKMWYLVNQQANALVTSFQVPDTFRIALVLPFYGSANDTAAIQSRSYPALWFYEGFLLALEETYVHLPPIQIKVIDTWGDPTFCENTVLPQLDRFRPHLIIGGMFKSETEPIAQYCQKRAILHLVPFLTTQMMARDNPYTFYLNPTLTTQYETLLTYAIGEKAKESGKVKISVLYEGKEAEGLKGIEKAVEQAKDSITIHVKYEELPLSDSLFYTYCKRHIENALNEQIHIIVFLSSKEHRIEHFLSTLSRLNYRLQFNQLIGHETWFFYPNLNRQSLEIHNTYIYSGYFEGNDSLLTERFRKAYLQRYGDLPNFYAIQGYETGRVLLKAWEKVTSWKNWQDLFYQIPPVKGICQNFYWGKAQDNQSVQILTYHKGSFQRLFLWKQKSNSSSQ